MRLLELNSQWRPKLGSSRGEQFYQDGYVQADVMFDDDSIVIITWSSRQEGQGHSARALEWLRNQFNEVVVQDPGPEGSSSFSFWKRMFEKGYVTNVIDDSGASVLESLKDSK